MAEEKKALAAEEKAETAPKTSATKKPAAEKKAPAKKAAAKKPAAEKKAPAEKKTAEKKAPAKKAAKGATVTVSAKAKTAVEEPKKGTVKVTLRRALTGRKKSQIAVAASLGLKNVGDVTFQPDNAATSGKIKKISFLLDVQKA